MLGLLFLGFFLLLVIAMPIAFAMSGSAILALVLQGQVPLTLVVQRIYAGADSFPLLAIPFFIIAGELMTQSGMTDSLVELCDALLGHLRSGLASVSILACMVFAGISGSGSADAAAIGTVMTPQLVAKGYPKGLAASIIATAGALGPIIPPSILMIIYGAIAEESVGKLFLAGFIPGVLIGLGLMGVAYAWNRKRGWESGSGRRPSLGAMVRALGRAALPLGTPVIIVGGIVGGVFTATEAGVVAAVYALAAAILAAGMPLAKIRAALVRSGLLSSLSLFIVSMASIFGWIMAREGFPSLIADLLLRASGGHRLLAAGYVILFLLIFGFFVEVIAMMVIFVPVLAPLAPALGFDSIHWGLLMVMAMNVGGVTPPVGTNLFIAASIAGCSLGEISHYVMPFVAIHVVIILLVLVLPGLALWIPGLVFPGR
jgi:C4-dicarboxylate transporter DctM subunit